MVSSSELSCQYHSYGCQSYFNLRQVITERKVKLWLYGLQIQMEGFRKSSTQTITAQIQVNGLKVRSIFMYIASIVMATLRTGCLHNFTNARLDCLAASQRCAIYVHSLYLVAHCTSNINYLYRASCPTRVN